MYQHTPTHIQMYPIFIQTSERYPNASKHRKHTQAHQNKSKYKEMSPGTEIIPYTDRNTQIHQHMSRHRNTPEPPKPVFKYPPVPNKYTRETRNPDEITRNADKCKMTINSPYNTMTHAINPVCLQLSVRTFLAKGTGSAGAFRAWCVPKTFK